ncbi:MAG TPA: hypothetical protein VN426_09170 [Syntrophomonadaceae bacterium]|nr:hypothetical protein [Syntrophomonadaceae bacterium]
MNEARFKNAPYARNVWDMQLFDGKVYLGYGDAVSDAGPIPIIYYDPQSGKFVNQFTVDEEQVDVYRIMDGKLSIPGTDATESWSYGNFYTLNNGNWDKHRTIPITSHVYDIAFFKGKIYAAVESQSHDASLPADIALTASGDGGMTWTSQMPKDSSFFTCGGCVGRTLFEFNGKLYCVGTLTPGYNTDSNNKVLVVDDTKTSIQKMANMLPGAKELYSHRILRPTTVSSTLLYLGVIRCNGCQWEPDGLFRATDLDRASKVMLPESQALPTDILVRGTTAYVLAYVPQANKKFVNIVYKSDDLNTWTELFRFTGDAFARSFEEVNGDFYFGLGCDTSIKPASTGSILKVSKNAYN